MCEGEWKRRKILCGCDGKGVSGKRRKIHRCEGKCGRGKMMKILCGYEWEEEKDTVCM